MNDLEKTFSYTKDQLRLSKSEKALGRARLMQRMQRGAAAQRPQLSPWNGLFAPAFRYGALVLAFLIVGSSSAAFAAESSLPGSSLYTIKLNVTEPIRVALAHDPQKRADLEVSLVDRRLKELAEASSDGTIEPEDVAVVSASLARHVNEAQKNIAALDRGSGDAFESASDLESTLSAHADILDKVQDISPAVGEAIAPVVDTVTTELTETSVLVDSAQDSVNATASALTEPTGTQADETRDDLVNLQNKVDSTIDSFDTSDKASLEASFAGIRALIEQAQALENAGDIKGAYVLYMEASQQITELKVTVEADQSLGIDVIEEAPTSDTTETP